MSLRNEFMAIAEGHGISVAELAKRFGISRKTAYKWLKRDAARDRLANREFHGGFRNDCVRSQSESHHAARCPSKHRSDDVFGPVCACLLERRFDLAKLSFRNAAKLWFRARSAACGFAWQYYRSNDRSGSVATLGARSRQQDVGDVTTLSVD